MKATEDCLEMALPSWEIGLKRSASLQLPILSSKFKESGPEHASNQTGCGIRWELLRIGS